MLFFSWLLILNTKDNFYFQQLKEAVATTFLEHHSAPSVIKDWGGESIVLFQEDLFNKVKAKVSEKWFYTYFKNSPEKLPRIDMLNLLAAYVGYENWHAFKASLEEGKKEKRVKKSYLLLVVPIMVLVSILMTVTSENEFHFCFLDDIKNTPITATVLDIKVLQDQESPIYFKTDSLGCFSYKTKADKVTFVVQSPFHKTDTIIRYIDSNNNNSTVRLQPDDYALMLHYYSNGNVKDWKKHKRQLEHLIDDDALIYQLFDTSIGVEVFTKAEFVRLLTIPTQNLKKVKILQKSMRHGKIVKLKFIIK